MASQQPGAVSADQNGSSGLRTPLIIASVVAVCVLFAAGAGAAAWRYATTAGPAEPLPPAAAELVDGDFTPTPTALPTVIPANTRTAVAPVTPTTASPLAPEAGQDATLPLPTVTPTPEIAPVAPREAEISGATTLRLSLSSEDFESTGQPLSFAIAPRPYTFGDDRLSATDAWCMQMGLANVSYKLDLQLDPKTEELAVTGEVALREGFCSEPGAVMDAVEVNLAVPTDAAAQISYNLRGRRSLFGVTGLLDTDTGAIIELRVTNSRPR